jgi:hypothetical protein
MKSFRWMFLIGLALACVLGALNCAPNDTSATNGQLNGPARIQWVHFYDPLKPQAINPPIHLRSARNETISFALQINSLPDPTAKRSSLLRLSPLQSNGASVPIKTSAWQIVPMPVDTNRAGFARHTGLPVGLHRMPRALLPLVIDNDQINLATLRDPEDPTNPRLHPSRIPPLIWFDVQIPASTSAADYQTKCELVENGRVTLTVPINISVDDFVIPDERHLSLAGLVDWESLTRHWPQAFEGLTPSLLSRREARHEAAIRILDDIVKLAQANRAQLVISQLQPIVKWPSGKPPELDWAEFDSVVGPWLRGDAFADKVPLGYWPLPTLDKLDLHERSSRNEYWQAAAAHFDAMQWLGRSAVVVEKRSPGRMTLEETYEFSEQAAQILSAHPRIRVSVPLEEEQIHLASVQFPRLIPADSLDRLLYAAPGLVSVPPVERLPTAAAGRWLRTDLPGLVPYIGAGADEREARLWAWLAFLRDARLIQWTGVLPSLLDPEQPGYPDEMIWFYPGQWFGVRGPVPSLQLKWLQRAEQDYEYLWLARQRKQEARALVLARLMTKPIELQPAQRQDPVYALLCGTANYSSWAHALDLLSRTILLSQPGQLVDPTLEKQLAIDTAAWSKLQERPMLLARTAEWWFAPNPEGPFVELRAGIDIYNAADRQPENNRIQWAALPPAWTALEPGLDISKLGTFHVDRVNLSARVKLSQVNAASRQPLAITFIDGFTGRPHQLQMVAPVAWCEKRQGPPPYPDGRLGDWVPEDALHEGKLVQMCSRPALQNQELRFSETDSAIYSSWTGGAFHLGFRVDGIEKPNLESGRNFVEHELRRAWREDVCELLFQAVYADNTLGPLLYVAAKPQGQVDVARRLDRQQHANPWMAFSGADIRYGFDIDKTLWRGEIDVPWDAFNDPAHQGKRPVLLRFNFSQHRGATGESASWAGPIDFGRDETFMGALQIRQPDNGR